MPCLGATPARPAAGSWGARLPGWVEAGVGRSRPRPERARARRPGDAAGPLPSRPISVLWGGVTRGSPLPPEGVGQGEPGGSRCASAEGRLRG